MRPDFEPADLVTLYQAMAEVIRCRPDGWRRFLAVHLDGLRADHG
ncbi:hypothetical protein [Kutzneria sp. 744]|nr:hypothetical protein [Kutzneria sp. 744]